MAALKTVADLRLCGAHALLNTAEHLLHQLSELGRKAAAILHRRRDRRERNPVKNVILATSTRYQNQSGNNGRNGRSET
jgi:hypothetical protein